MTETKSFKDRYKSLTDIGKPFGISSRQLGQVLKDAGLRDDSGSPTKESLGSGLARSTPLKSGFAHYMWNRDEVVKILEMKGIVSSRASIVRELIEDIEPDIYIGEDIPW